MYNAKVYSQAKLALVRNLELSKMILVECLVVFNIQEKELILVTAMHNDNWGGPIIIYLQKGEELTFKVEARKLWYKVAHYLLINSMLYKHDHSLPYLRCLAREEVEYVLREIHERVCANHFTSQLLARKVLK